MEVRKEMGTRKGKVEMERREAALESFLSIKFVAKCSQM